MYILLLNLFSSPCFYRFESFNSHVRMYNVYGNRLAPSRDIAKRFSVLQHLRSICLSGNPATRLKIMTDLNILLSLFYSRCGGALKELYLAPFVQHLICGISSQELHSDKNMYKAGVARKVRICVHIATNCILCCNCVLGIMALMQPVSCVT